MKRIPFKPHFRKLVKEEKKSMTTRTKRYGKEGDLFSVSKDCTIRLLLVTKTCLAIVANTYWREEGCTSPNHFINEWKCIHPKRGYVPTDIVWLHSFERVV